MVSIVENLPRSFVHAYERHGRWLPLAAKILLTVVLARLAAEFVWLWVPVPENAAWKPAPYATGSSAAPAAPSGPNPELIASSHLFGNFQAPADPALAQMDKAPETRLALTLMGIFAADDEKASRALIGTQGGDEQPFAVGEDIVRGVKLQAIFADRVILAREGKLETLRLDKDQPDRPLVGRTEAPAPGLFANAGGGETTEMLGKIRETILQDPSKASDYIRVQPANVNGQQRGYRIYPGRDRGVFNGAGLRPGDMVTSVNGVQLDDPAKALQMLGDLSQAGTLNLTIERGGQQQAITVNLN